MDDKNKKKYVIPEADLVEFANNDIISLSAEDQLNWDGGDNEEPF